MIPLKIQIKNFVSYGSNTQVINFEPYHLICFSGKNGHGKSALLDAITWSIWGQARKVQSSSKADEGLLRLGQTNMMVTLDFICNSQSYRIRREFTVFPNKNQTELEFGIIDTTSNSFRSLTDKTIRATQDKINEILGLDFESFINSAFLRQGQSNEFSKKSPKERKEVLATILRLDYYEKIRKASSEKAKEYNSQKELLVFSKKRIEAELELKNNLNNQLKEIENNLTNISLEENYNKNLLENIIKEKEKLDFVKQNYNFIAYKFNHINQQITDKLIIFKKDIYNFRSTLYHIINREKINLLQEHEQLTNKLKLLQENTKLYLILKEQYLQLKEKENSLLNTHSSENIIESEKLKVDQQKVILECSLINQQLQEISKRKIFCANEIGKYNAEKDILKNGENSNNKLAEEFEFKFEKRKSFYQKLLTNIGYIQQEIKNYQEKRRLAQDIDKPQCALCQQDLSKEHRHLLLTNFDKKEKILLHQENRLINTIKSLKEILKEQYNILEQNKKNKETLASNNVKAQEIDKQILILNNEIKKLDEEDILSKNKLIDLRLILDKSQKNLEEFNLKTNIENNPIYKDIKKEQYQLQEKLKQTNIDKELEKEIETKLEKLNLLIKNQQELQAQETLQDERKKVIHQQNLHLKQLKLEIKSLEVEKSKLEKILSNENQILQQELLTNNKLGELSKLKEGFILNKGAFDQQIKNLLEKEKELKTFEIQIDKLQQTCDEYLAISSALSKDGVQALLIEDAIPEIEQEANLLLARLTDNQAHLSIESLRDLKSGGTKETLDIKISDTIGIRPYELFSGGEAFRIDFALRIAISKLLARRAGTALQTLIIDEGFGSQDEEGLALIMDSIYKIQQDFAKIIIVSHLPNMKDQFPVNFLIHKTGNGSMVKVIENG